MERAEIRKKAQCVFDYHQATKHMPGRYAPSPQFMDWATEPNPYRRYEGTETTSLPLLTVDPCGGYDELFLRKKEPKAFKLKNIAAFLELSMGLSAMKSFMDSTWALRMNPSSGNLHPTEAYLITMGKNPSGAIFHYSPASHALEKRAELSADLIDGLGKSLKADGFITFLTSIDWREAWKYGSRAFRYSCIDKGHALASISFSAALLGWRISPLDTLSDRDIRDMLGFNETAWTRYEEERVEGAFFVHKTTESRKDAKIEKTIIKTFKKIRFNGSPNRLSPEHVHWPIIEKIIDVTEKPGLRQEPPRKPLSHQYLYKDMTGQKGAGLIRKRRSAQAFNTHSVTTEKKFFSIIERTIPTPSSAPFDALPGKAEINLIIFVHRVEGLAQGLYILMRNKDDMGELKEKMRDDFLWKQSGYEGLFLLLESDLADEARYISCGQDIAGDGAFSIAMLARFRENILNKPFSYRDLFMEAGIVGQVLYLAAEAQGLRGTGIGCFYDDMLHEFIGLKKGDNTFQSLYHFTVGTPVLDERITTLAPYSQRS